MATDKYLRVSDEARAAVNEGRPVVALESTIISHGMPYPKNVETALRVEDAVRSRGAVPATVAILGGVMTVGASRDEIEYLGKLGTKAAKASRRDLPMLAARGLDGATTVAATMILANRAGVRVFATGGVGGVHRGAETTMDVSADLEELARTPVLVVCAGCKSILDLNLTMEYLETKGVPVLGFGTNELPAFYARESGISLEWRVDDAREIARAFRFQTEGGLGGGMLVANPVPEAYAMDAKVVGRAIDEAVSNADKMGLRGKAVTPFLLERIRNLTGGESLESNIQLVLNNARLGADIAAALSAGKDE